MRFFFLPSKSSPSTVTDVSTPPLEVASSVVNKVAVDNVDLPRITEVGDVVLELDNSLVVQHVKGAKKGVRWLHRLHKGVDARLLSFRTKVSEGRRVKAHWILYVLYLALVLGMAYVLSLIDSTYASEDQYGAMTMCGANEPAKISISILTITVSLIPLLAGYCCGNGNTPQICKFTSHIKTSLRSKVLFIANAFLLILLPILATLGTIRPCTEGRGIEDTVLHYTDPRQAKVAAVGAVVAIITALRIIFNTFCALRLTRDTKVQIVRQKADGLLQILEAFSDAHGILFLKAVYGLVQNVWSLITFQPPVCGITCDYLKSSSSHATSAFGVALFHGELLAFSSLADQQRYVLIFIAAFGCAGALLEFTGLVLWGHGSGLSSKAEPETFKNTIAVKCGMKLDCERRVSITEGGAGSIKFFMNICILVTDLAVGLATLCFGSVLSTSQLVYGIIEFVFAMVESQHLLQTWLICLLRRDDYIGVIPGAAAANITVKPDVPRHLVEYGAFKVGYHTAVASSTPTTSNSTITEEQEAPGC